MKKKLGMKLCSISLVLVMVVSLFSGMFTISAGAAAPTATVDPDTVTSYSVWDGTTTDTAWESAGTNAFYITSAAELAGLASAVNGGTTYDGYTFYITAHIDLGGYTWKPIGNNKNFGGSLIGAYGKTAGSDVVIANMNIPSASYANQGLVGKFTGAEISSITLLDPTVTFTKNGLSFFAGYALTNAKTFSDLAVVNGTMTVNGSGSGTWVGGIVGRQEIAATYTNCYVDAKMDIVGHKYVGGLVGYANTNATFTNCATTADITVTNVDAAGFVGYAESGTFAFTGCYSGAMVRAADKYVGGFIGYLGTATTAATATFTRCQFDGVVGSAATQGGAFIGRLQCSNTSGNTVVSIDNSVNTGASVNGYGVDNGGVSWIGLIAGNSAAKTYLTLTLKNNTCYSAIDTGIAPRNDAIADYPITVALTYYSGSTNNTASVDCGSSATALDSYDDPTLLKSVSNMSSEFTTSNGWSINDAGMPYLTLAGYMDNPYLHADLTWLSLTVPSAADEASTIPDISASITTTAQYLGLAKLSHLYGFPVGIYDLSINWTNIDTTKVTDDLFADGFELALNERATYSFKVNGSAVDYDVFSVALQTRAGDADGYYDVRFISSVNSLDNYDKVGFEITRNDTGAKMTLSTTKVYTSIKGADVAYTPADTFADASTHFYAVVVDNVPADMSITVQAFADLTNGTRVYGKAERGTLGASSGTATTLDTVASTYQIVYADGNAETREVALSLRDRIKATTGVYMPVVTDTAANANTSVTKDILVGCTSRVDGEERDLGYYEMMIYRPVTNKILIMGGSDITYEQACIHLVSTLQASSVTNVNNISWSAYAAGDDSWAISTITNGAESYLSSFTPAWADSSWSYTDDYANSWISDFHEKTAAMLKGGRVTSKSHRGDVANYPANSIEGIASAILAGVDAVEFDIQITLDGVPVLMHNASMESTTNVEDYVGRAGYPNSAFVCDWTYAQLKALYLTDSNNALTTYKIATLYEALKLCADRVFVQIDDKTRKITGGSYGVINDSDTVYNIATAAEARETLMHFYYDEDVYSISGRTYTSVYKNWINTYNIDDSTHDDECFVMYIEWCESLGTSNIQKSYWPNTQNSSSYALEETASRWNTMKLYARTIWTENPYALCTWIQTNYNNISYTVPDYPLNTDDPPEDITPAGSNLTVYTYDPGDVVDWSTLFPSN